MSKVVVSVSVSLDGYVTGPNVSAAAPMGEGGERLHAWMEGAGPGGQIDLAVFNEINAGVGAAVVGRHTFDLGLPLWGGTPWPATPTFVVTHRPLQDFEDDNGGTFAFDVLEAAVARARQAAGDRNVMVLGPNISRQLLAVGLLDELWIQLVPTLLGGGTRPFDGEAAELQPVEKPRAGTVTHLRFRVAKA